MAAVTASWFAAKMAIDYDANKENGKTSLQVVEALIDLQVCASRYVRKSEWKSKLESGKAPKHSFPEEKEICSIGALKKAMAGFDGALPPKQYLFVEKLYAELKEEIEQISAAQLKSVLPARDSINSTKAIMEAFRTSQGVVVNRRASR